MVPHFHSFDHLPFSCTYDPNACDKQMEMATTILGYDGYVEHHCQMLFVRKYHIDSSHVVVTNTTSMHMLDGRNGNWCDLILYEYLMVRLGGADQAV